MDDIYFDEEIRLLVKDAKELMRNARLYSKEIDIDNLEHLVAALYVAYEYKEQLVPRYRKD